MCVLADVELSRRLALLTDERIVVYPLGTDAIQPGSVDLRLGTTLMMLLPRNTIVDPEDPDTFEETPVKITDGRGWIIKPGILYLATTYELIRVPDDLRGQLTGKSTTARLGIVPHQQAGLLDAGYEGRPTLEIDALHWTYLRPTMPIAQVEFSTMTSMAERPYGHASRRSRYQNDVEPTMARPRKS